MKPTTLRRLVPIVLAACLGFLLGGCNSSTYAVKVDSIAKRETHSGAADPQSFKIKSKNPALGEENLRYREAADYVKTALSGKGLYEAPNPDAADLVVELDYGMEAPRTKIETVSVPRYGQVGGGVRYDQVAVVDARGNTSYRTVAVYQPPRTELIGFDDIPQRVTVYEKYLRISARENKPGVEGHPPVEVWSVQTSTEDESSDLRKYLPIMASATADYIGKDTAKPKVVKVKDPSAVVDFIRKGMNETPAVATQAPLARPKI